MVHDVHRGPLPSQSEEPERPTRPHSPGHAALPLPAPPSGSGDVVSSTLAPVGACLRANTRSSPGVSRPGAGVIRRAPCLSVPTSCGVPARSTQEGGRRCPPGGRTLPPAAGAWDLERAGAAEAARAARGACVGPPGHPRWLWPARAPPTGTGWAYGGGRRQASVLWRRTALLAPCGLPRSSSESGGADPRPLAPAEPGPGTRHPPPSARQLLTCRTRLTRLARTPSGCAPTTPRQAIVMGLCVNRSACGRAVETWPSPLLKHYPRRRLPHSSQTLRTRRQGKEKGGAVIVVGDGPQLAAMRLHDGAANPQPHAHAARLGGKERLEHLLDLLSAQPDAASFTLTSTSPSACRCVWTGFVASGAGER